MVLDSSHLAHVVQAYLAETFCSWSILCVLKFHVAWVHAVTIFMCFLILFSFHGHYRSVVKWFMACYHYLISNKATSDYMIKKKKELTGLEPRKRTSVTHDLVVCKLHSEIYGYIFNVMTCLNHVSWKAFKTSPLSPQHGPYTICQNSFLNFMKILFLHKCFFFWGLFYVSTCQ